MEWNQNLMRRSSGLHKETTFLLFRNSPPKGAKWGPKLKHLVAHYWCIYFWYWTKIYPGLLLIDIMKQLFRLFDIPPPRGESGAQKENLLDQYNSDIYFWNWTKICPNIFLIDIKKLLFHIFEIRPLRGLNGANTPLPYK